MSEDYSPRWRVANKRGPVARQYAEAVEVMPVSEHGAAQSAIRMADRFLVELSTELSQGQIVKWTAYWQARVANVRAGLSAHVVPFDAGENQ